MQFPDGPMLTATDQGMARFGALGKSLEALLHSSVRTGMSVGWDVVHFRTNWKSVCRRRSGSNPIKDSRIAQLTQHAEEQSSTGFQPNGRRRGNGSVHRRVGESVTAKHHPLRDSGSR